MARKAKDPKHYDKLRKASGWYAAAWRDYRQMTLQDVADAINSSRGQVSDLETGAKTRFNRDWLEQMCAVYDVAAGDLIDTNPFSELPKYDAIKRAFPGLNDDDLGVLTDMAAAIKRRKA